MQPPDVTAPRRRPRAISFVASLLLLEALIVVLIGAAMLTIALAGLPMPDDMPDGVFGPLIDAMPALGLAVIIVVSGGGLALASVGLLRLREWAWVLAMALQGVALADALWETYVGQPQHLTLAVGSFVVLVLNQREVRQAFDGRHAHV